MGNGLSEWGGEKKKEFVLLGYRWTFEEWSTKKVDLQEGCLEVDVDVILKKLTRDEGLF